MADYSNDEPAQKLPVSYSGQRILGKKKYQGRAEIK